MNWGMSTGRPHFVSSSHAPPRTAALWEVVPFFSPHYSAAYLNCGDVWRVGSLDLPPAPPLLFLLTPLASEPHEPGVPGAEPGGWPGRPPLLLGPADS